MAYGIATVSSKSGIPRKVTYTLSGTTTGDAVVNPNNPGVAQVETITVKDGAYSVASASAQNEQFLLETTGTSRDYFNISGTQMTNRTTTQSTLATNYYIDQTTGANVGYLPYTINGRRFAFTNSGGSSGNPGYHIVYGSNGWSSGVGSYATNSLFSGQGNGTVSNYGIVAQTPSYVYYLRIKGGPTLYRSANGSSWSTVFTSLSGYSAPSGSNANQPTDNSFGGMAGTDSGGLAILVSNGARTAWRLYYSSNADAASPTFSNITTLNISLNTSKVITSSGSQGGFSESYVNTNVGIFWLGGNNFLVVGGPSASTNPQAYVVDVSANTKTRVDTNIAPRLLGRGMRWRENVSGFGSGTQNLRGGITACASNGSGACMALAANAAYYDNGTSYTVVGLTFYRRYTAFLNEDCVVTTNNFNTVSTFQTGVYLDRLDISGSSASAAGNRRYHMSISGSNMTIGYNTSSTAGLTSRYYTTGKRFKIAGDSTNNVYTVGSISESHLVNNPNSARDTGQATFSVSPTPSSSLSGNDILWESTPNGIHYDETSGRFVYSVLDSTSATSITRTYSCNTSFTDITSHGAVGITAYLGRSGIWPNKSEDRPELVYGSTNQRPYNFAWVDKSSVTISVSPGSISDTIPLGAGLSGTGLDDFIEREVSTDITNAFTVSTGTVGSNTGVIFTANAATDYTFTATGSNVTTSVIQTQMLDSDAVTTSVIEISIPQLDGSPSELSTVSLGAADDSEIAEQIRSTIDSDADWTATRSGRVVTATAGGNADISDIGIAVTAAGTSGLTDTDITTVVTSSGVDPTYTSGFITVTDGTETQTEVADSENIAEAITSISAAVGRLFSYNVDSTTATTITLTSIKSSPDPDITVSITNGTGGDMTLSKNIDTEGVPGDATILSDKLQRYIDVFSTGTVNGSRTISNFRYSDYLANRGFIFAIPSTPSLSGDNTYVAPSIAVTQASDGNATVSWTFPTLTAISTRAPGVPSGGTNINSTIYAVLYGGASSDTEYGILVFGPNGDTDVIVDSKYQNIAKAYLNTTTGNPSTNSKSYYTTNQDRNTYPLGYLSNYGIRDEVVVPSGSRFSSTSFFNAYGFPYYNTDKAFAGSMRRSGNDLILSSCTVAGSAASASNQTVLRAGTILRSGVTVAASGNSSFTDDATHTVAISEDTIINASTVTLPNTAWTYFQHSKAYFNNSNAGAGVSGGTNLTTTATTINDVRRSRWSIQNMINDGRAAPIAASSFDSYSELFTESIVPMNPYNGSTNVNPSSVIDSRNNAPGIIRGIGVGCFSIRTIKDPTTDYGLYVPHSGGGSVFNSEDLYPRLIHAETINLNDIGFNYSSTQSSGIWNSSTAPVVRTISYTKVVKPYFFCYKTVDRWYYQRGEDVRNDKWAPTSGYTGAIVAYSPMLRPVLDTDGASTQAQIVWLPVIRYLNQFYNDNNFFNITGFSTGHGFSATTSPQMTIGVLEMDGIDTTLNFELA